MTVFGPRTNLHGHPSRSETFIDTIIIKLREIKHYTVNLTLKLG